MFLSTLKRGSALAVSTVLLAGIAANANPVAPRAAARPSAQGIRPEATVPGKEQVLIEGGTLAANYDGNLADILGYPIACTTIAGDDRDCAAESSIPTKAVTTYQFLYAAVGTGGAQLDFVNWASGSAGKTASSAPEFADSFDAYDNSAPYGFAPWAGTAASTDTADSLHAAAGDAPLPLGPSEGADFTGTGFSYYADSFEAYDNGHNSTVSDGTGGGYNSVRGPAIVTPVIGTGVSIIFNTTGLTIPSGGLNLTQDDVCGIFTGTITNWNQTSANPGTQAITIVHRSDGSGTTFLTAYDLSQMCSTANPLKAGTVGKPVPAHFWNQSGFTQGVGTDSSNLTSSGTIVTDTTAPEVAWPNNSLPESKTGGVIAGVAATAGGVGYVSPSNTLGANTLEAYVQNYGGNYEQATTATVAASLSSTTSSDVNPPAYPKSATKNILYFPFPTAATGDAIVGYSYGYFYTCTHATAKDQVAGVKAFFGYGDSSKTLMPYQTVASFWNLDYLDSTQLKNLSSELGLMKTAAVTKPTTYYSPVDGSKQTYTCTDSY
jgi:ABC-type phosphate transport system substrate-binding protein